MSPRSATYAVAGALLVALAAVASLLPVPYVVFAPGPLANTLGEVDGEPVVQVDGAPTYPTDGVLELTTVAVTPAAARLDLATALRAWVDPHRAVLPRRYVYPDDSTPEEVREQNAELMQRSQETAVVTALRAVGYEVPEAVVVEAVLADAPAQGVLKAGDVVRSVEGTPITTPEQMRSLVSAHSPGQPLPVQVEREGQLLDLQVPTGPAEDDPQRAVVGVQPASGFDLPVDVHIALSDEIGGSSAGLVFSLAVYDTLTPGPLLAGRHAAGTGMIDSEGRVRPIGGIQQKIVAARESGAEIFLTPEDNCDEAVGADAGDMRLVEVASFDVARRAVESFAAGRLDELPTCPA